jgi:hypothetical protein
MVKLLILALVLSGCSWGAPEIENRSPVKQIGVDEYIYDFKDKSECHTDECYKFFAEKKIESLNLVPTQCQNGIEVISRGGPNNGWAFVKFRCVSK